jgi:glycosyltransferase involved in cell wall biosynthesis
MRIAVNTRSLLNDDLEGYGSFIYEIFKRITSHHPEHEFIFIFDRPFDERFVAGKNVKAVRTGPPARHPLFWKLWYDFRVPSLLKKNKADVFVSCDGFCSLTTQLPQCLIVPELSFLHHPDFFKQSHLLFYKKNTEKFLKKANTVAVVSEFLKKDLLDHYNLSPEKIDVVFSSVKENFHSFTEEEKTETKNKYTEGKEYFVYTGMIHPLKNLMNLLKAFSVFKKRQQTNMKLLLTGRLGRKYDSFLKSLGTYKYRSDVVMTGYLPEEELVKITGAAYGMVYPSLWEGFAVPVLEAMQCDVPVITSGGSSMQETAKDAALYADATSYADIADKMMLLYKDEHLRNQLINKGRQVVKQYNWDNTADLLWNCIVKACR